MTPERLAKLKHVAERGHKQQIPQAADMLELLAEVSRLTAENADLRKALKGMQSVPRARICCLKCNQLMAIKYRDLWAPTDSDSKVKCDMCGEWSTLKELHLASAMQPTAPGASGTTAKPEE